MGTILPASRPLKIITLVPGIGCILDSLGKILNMPVIAEAGLNIYLLFAIVWAIWMGVTINTGKTASV